MPRIGTAGSKVVKSTEQLGVECLVPVHFNRTLACSFYEIVNVIYPNESYDALFMWSVKSISVSQ